MTVKDTCLSFEDRFSPDRLALTADRIKRGDFDYLDFLDSRLKRVTDLKIRYDLVQLDRVVNWLVAQSKDRNAVLAELRGAVFDGEFGIIEPRHTVKDLRHLRSGIIG
jgi:hypothetical protein